MYNQPDLFCMSHHRSWVTAQSSTSTSAPTQFLLPRGHQPASRYRVVEEASCLFLSLRFLHGKRTPPPASNCERLSISPGHYDGWGAAPVPSKKQIHHFPIAHHAPMQAERTSPRLTAFLLDTVTGRVLHSQMHGMSRGPVRAIFTENLIAFDFWDEASARCVCV